MSTRSPTRDGSCPCGSGESYPGCCGRFHGGDADAPTAALLMRARYSAFARGDADYLRRTWHPRTRPRRMDVDPEVVWTGLTVLDAARGGLLDTDGEVEFVARYERAGTRGRLAERSRFVRVDGRWAYVDGVPAFGRPG